MATNIPEKLFILELANNHMGDVEHGIRVIQEFGQVCRDFDFNFAFKMQYRQLDSFIHPDFRDRTDIKYIKRFQETRLDRDQTRRLVAAIKAEGFTAICTPFDEASVDLIIEDGFDILKIASCSFTDWPLLEKIASTDKPVIGSTAGIALEDIDRVVAFMQHRNKDFVLMHCVAEYPTKSENLQLNQIDFLQKRYPGLRIGYSTHESPAEQAAIAMAVAKGCTAFEKHVGVRTETYALNDYSADPAQVRAWLEAARHAYAVAGLSGQRIEPSEQERTSLLSLRRGLFAKRDIAAGETLTNADVFMAIPTQEGHVTANDWSKYTLYSATQPIKAGSAVLESNTSRSNVREKVYSIVQRVKKLLAESGIRVPGEVSLEISHHYGLEKFDEVGITMLTVINREYCKKLIVVLPGQQHPAQYHKMKEETFNLLHGDLNLSLDGVSRAHGAGSVVVVERGVVHAFTSAGGAVIEEISSTHHGSDSYYVDDAINRTPNRKTFVTHWMD